MPCFRKCRPFCQQKFCSGMNLDKWSLSLPHGDKRSVVPCTVELQGLQKTWTHANGCVLPKTQSQYLLLFWCFRTLEPRHLTLTFRLGCDLLQLGGRSMGWWRLALDMRVSLDWKRQRTKSRWQRTAGLQVCSFHSLVNESWALQWVCEIPPGLLPPSGQFGWLNPTHSKVTHTWYWHQDA